MLKLKTPNDVMDAFSNMKPGDKCVYFQGHLYLGSGDRPSADEVAVADAVANLYNQGFVELVQERCRDNPKTQSPHFKYMMIRRNKPQPPTTPLRRDQP